MEISGQLASYKAYILVIKLSTEYTLQSYQTVLQPRGGITAVVIDAALLLTMLYLWRALYILKLFSSAMPPSLSEEQCPSS